MSASAGSIIRAKGSDGLDIPADGLVLHYPFDGDAQDASGHGNHGMVHDALLAEDKFGNARSAYYLNGRNAHIFAPVCISPSVMPQVTMVVWAKVQDPERVTSLLTNGRDGRGRELSMRPSPGRGGCWATSTHSLGSWVWEEIEAEKWTFLAVSYDQDAKQLRLHVNANTYEEECATVDGETHLIMGLHSRWGQSFHGYLDEIRVYDRVLTEMEIAALYHQFLHGHDDAAFHAGGRQGIKFAFISGFVIFFSVVLLANLWIRGGRHGREIHLA